MKGLLIKDFLVLGKQLRIIGLLMLFYFVMGAVLGTGMASAFSFGIVICCIMIVVSSFAYDDQAKWNDYCRALPVSAHCVVLSKYLLMLLCTVIGVALVALLLALTALINHEIINMPESMGSILTLSLVALLLTSILIPFVVWLGTEKARVILMAIIMVPTLMILFLDDLQTLLPMLSDPSTLVPFLAVVVVIVMTLSYFASVGLYKKKSR